MSVPSRDTLPPTNLPVQLTSFIGRAREQSELGSLARQHRLVTLVGAGGAGKTRLAVRVAADLAAEHVDGAWWVDLAPLTEAALVADAALAAFGVPDAADRNSLQRLVAHLANRDLLLVLDNCEHVRDACTALVDVLLRTCPRVRMLATSREALGVGGEVSWQIPPLTLPDPDADVALESLGSYESVQLFVERAVRARPNFAVSNATAPVVAEICARLDGIPLAIELAASRVRVLSPRQILDGLADRFRLLTGGSRTALPRQQTLEASVAWSHDQLTAGERAVFRRLSVFAGGFTLDGAEAVATFDGGPEPVEVLDLLDSLVAKSLVVVDAREDHVRYRLLETLRHFASLRLDEAGEAAPARDAHLRHCRLLAREAIPRLLGVTAGTVVELTADQDNWRHAFAWAIAGADAGAALEIVYAHAWLLNLRGRYREVCDTVNRLPAASAESARSRIRALWARGLAQWSLGDLRAVEDTAAEVVALGEESEDVVVLAYGQNMAAWVQMFWNPPAASATLDAGWDLVLAAADPWLSMNLPCDCLHVAVRRDDLDAAETWLARTQAAVQACGSEYFMAWTHGPEAVLAMRRGDLAHARMAGARAMDLARGLGDQSAISYAASVVVWVELLCGRPEVARTVAQRALRESDAAADTICRSNLLLGHAVAAGELGDREWCTGAVEAVEVAARLGDACAHACAVLELAHAQTEREDYAQAQQWIDAARADAAFMGSVWIEATCDHAQGLLELARGNAERAEDLQHAALAKATQRGYALVVVDAVEALARLAADAESWAEAVRLLAATQRRRDELGYRRGRTVEPAQTACRNALGPDAFEAAWQEGTGLDIGAAVAFASRARGARKRPSSGWAGLTPTELEVAHLAATGASNAAIAEKLFIAVGTTKVHLSHIYAKLGIANRTQLGAEVARRASKTAR